MRALIERVLNYAQLLGASYADVRVVHQRGQNLQVRNGAVTSNTERTDQGLGVRVIVNGAWGFASSAELTVEAAERVTASAVRIAKASALALREPVLLGPPVASVGVYRTPLQIDPFDVPLEDKVALLLQADAAMRGVEGVQVAQGVLTCQREDKTFANSEGSYVEQSITETGCGIVALAVEGSEIQQRSYPNSFGRDQRQTGWEYVLQADLPGNAERIGIEAVTLLCAEQCPSGVTTLILGPTQLALQIHESCGHPTELDRVFGSEAAYAGTSFLTVDKLGHYRYGSPIVNLTADATLPGGLGTFGWDDEGVPAQRVPLVQAGILAGYLSSRESMAQLSRLKGWDVAQHPSGGAMRASGWNRIPIVRMTNVSLEPGTWTFDDLIADTDDGIYMEMNRSWSIDDKRLNFQFGTEIAYEIKGGKLGRMYKNPTYTGITPEFWGGCDAICDAGHWQVWGTPNCGKGQPSQIAHTGHGAAPARFRNVRVGVLNK